MNVSTLVISCAALVGAGFCLFSAHRFERSFLAYGAAVVAAGFAVVPIWNDLLTGTDRDDPVSVGLSAGYLDFGAQQVPAQSAATRSSRQQLPSVPDMTRQLVARLEAAPADAKGWSLLAKSYAWLGNDSGVEGAIANAVRFGAEEDMLRSQVTAVRASR